jgi:hypothetical protein
MAANSREIYAKGYTYVITRRIIQRPTETVLRVRVRVYKGLDTHKSVKPVRNEHRDYVHLAQGDAIYAGHIAKISAL